MNKTHSVTNRPPSRHGADRSIANLSLALVVSFLLSPLALSISRVRAQPTKTPKNVDRNLVDVETLKILSNEVSAQIAFQTTMRLENNPRLPGDYEALKSIAETIEKRCEIIGLRSVHLIEQPSYYPPWKIGSADLWLTSPVSQRLASIHETPWCLAPQSQPGLIDAKLVDVGRGVSDSDYRNASVSGNVALASGPAHIVVQQAVWRRRALGIICYGESQNLDAIPTGIIPTSPDGNELEGSFAFFISPRRARQIQTMMRSDSNRSVKTVTVRSRIDSGTPKPGSQFLVEAMIPGTDPDLPQILLSARLEEFPMISSSGSSGCAALLEIARTINRLIEDNQLPRPRRTLRFWWSTGTSGIYSYFSNLPDQRKKILAAIHIDSLGERSGTEPDRGTIVLGTPFSRPSFLEDLCLATFDEVRRHLGKKSDSHQSSWSNQGFLISSDQRSSYRAPFPHDAFCDSTIGIPAISLANLDGRGSRPAGGSLSSINIKQLAHELLSTTAFVHFLARADDPSCFAAVRHAMAGARRRMNTELDLATSLLITSSEPWLDARSLFFHGLLHERSTIASLGSLFPVECTTLIHAKRDSLWSEGAVLMKDLGAAYGYLYNQSADPKDPKRTRDENRLHLKIPEYVGELGEHLIARQHAGALSADLPRSIRTYRPLAAAVLSAVDGRRSYADIYRLLLAADHYGRPYGEPVTLESVRKILDTAKTAGAIQIAENRFKR